MPVKANSRTHIKPTTVFLLPTMLCSIPHLPDRVAPKLSAPNDIGLEKAARQGQFPDRQIEHFWQNPSCPQMPQFDDKRCVPVYRFAPARGGLRARNVKQLDKLLIPRTLRCLMEGGRLRSGWLLLAILVLWLPAR